MGTKGKRLQPLSIGSECPDGKGSVGTAYCTSLCPHCVRKGSLGVLCSKVAQPFRWSEKVLQGKLSAGLLTNTEYTLENLRLFYWESDFLAKTTAGYWYECEIKISKADFIRDFKDKTEKHLVLSGGLDKPLKPNRFLYAVPDTLGMDILPLVPDYAGLVTFDKWSHTPMYLKDAPLLTKEKWTDEDLGLARKFYFNYLNYKTKYESFDEEKNSLLGEISFLKEEFKAVTGQSWKEYLGDAN